MCRYVSLCMRVSIDVYAEHLHFSPAHSVCVRLCVRVIETTQGAAMSQVTPLTPLLCSFFLSSLNSGLEVLNLEEITSTGQLRGEITRQSVIGGQHLGAASHINETSTRESEREEKTL